MPCLLFTQLTLDKWDHQSIQKDCQLNAYWTIQNSEHKRFSRAELSSSVVLVICLGNVWISVHHGQPQRCYNTRHVVNCYSNIKDERQKQLIERHLKLRLSPHGLVTLSLSLFAGPTRVSILHTISDLDVIIDTVEKRILQRFSQIKLETKLKNPCYVL